MANRMRYSSEKMQEVSVELCSLSNILESAKGELAKINMTERSGGALKLTTNMFSLSHGKFTGGPIASLHLKVFMRMMDAEREAIQDMARLVSKAATLFEETEQNIVNLISRTGENQKMGQYESKDQGELYVLRMEEMKNIIKALGVDEEFFRGFIDRGKLSKITGGMGNIYTFLSGNTDSYLTNAGHELAMSTLASLNNGDKISQGLLDPMADAGDKLGKAMDTSVNFVDIVSDGKLGGEFEKFLDNMPVTSDFKIGNMNVRGLNMEDIKLLGETAEGMQTVVNAFNDYRMMTSVDPQKLDSICHGMRASGDPTMVAAAERLEAIKNPETALAYSLVSNGAEVAASFLGEKANDALIKLYPSAAGQAIIKVSQDVSETLTNASGLVNSAYQIERMDACRRASEDAVRNAITAYIDNPSDSTYQTVADNYKTYNAMCEGTIGSVQDMINAHNDSMLGMLDRKEASSLDLHKSIYSSRIGYTSSDTLTASYLAENGGL